METLKNERVIFVYFDGYIAQFILNTKKVFVGNVKSGFWQEVFLSFHRPVFRTWKR
jgi:hypothetical protein